MNLAETQRLFWELLQGESRPLEAFTGTAELPAAERVAIYTRMVLHRQVDALRETFPEVAKELGDEAFFATAASYVRANPSDHPDLGQLGRRFAEFLQDESLRAIAAREWARAEVFEAAPAEPLTAEDFSRLAQDPESFMHARAKVIPALRLAGQTVVWRSGFEVFHVDVSDEEARALRLAVEGAPLGEICGAFAEPQAAFTALQSWIAEGWLRA